MGEGTDARWPGSGEALTRAADDPPTTGEAPPAVDPAGRDVDDPIAAAAAALAGVDGRPLAEHAEVYEQVNATLQDVLGTTEPASADAPDAPSAAPDPPSAAPDRVDRT